MEKIVKMKYEKITGLVAAPFTPMHVDGSVNFDVIGIYAEHLINSGVKGAFVCGTTGESASLTLDERKQIAQQWVDVAAGRLKIIVHAGSNCLAESAMLAADAQEMGADAVASICPCYFKPANVSLLVQSVQQIADACPQLPFYYYHIPSLTGVNFPIASFLSQAGDVIPNLAGIKFTYENIMDFMACMSIDNGRFDMLFGRDEMLLSGLAAGAQGAVGSTYNFAGPIYLKTIEAYHVGDMALAQKYQKQAVAMIQLMIEYGGLAAGKAIMKMIGIDCGPARLPLQALTEEQCQQLENKLQMIGILEPSIATQ